MASKDWKETELQSTQAQYQAALGEVALSFLQKHQSIFGELPALSGEGARMLQSVLDELYKVRLAMPEPAQAFDTLAGVKRRAEHAIETAKAERDAAEDRAWYVERRAAEIERDRDDYVEEIQKVERDIHARLVIENDKPSLRRVMMWLQRRGGESYTSWLGLVK